MNFGFYVDEAHLTNLSQCFSDSPLAGVFWLSNFKEKASVNAVSFFVALNRFGQLTSGKQISWKFFWNVMKLLRTQYRIDINEHG